MIQVGALAQGVRTAGVFDESATEDNQAMENSGIRS